jgi:hypothetical protein
MEATQKIQEVKRMLVTYINADRWNNNSQMELRDQMLSVVEDVRLANLGFASEIAATVGKVERCSEKQAYWIAKVAVENNLTKRIDYQFE